MKQAILFFLFLITTVAAHGQSEVPADTLRRVPELEGTKNFDGFLLDMNLLQQPAMPSPVLPRYMLELPNLGTDFNKLFRLTPETTYDKASTSIYGSNPFGLSLFNVTDNLHSATFRLKNGMRIQTQGQYNKEGRKVYNPSALPWEKNSFKGAFELKSKNGAFGIRVEVEQHR